MGLHLEFLAECPWWTISPFFQVFLFEWRSKKTRSAAQTTNEIPRLNRDGSNAEDGVRLAADRRMRESTATNREQQLSVVGCLSHNYRVATIAISNSMISVTFIDGYAVPVGIERIPPPIATWHLHCRQRRSLVD